ncbi:MULTISPECIES: lipid droplet-associated protein [unclassified Blastococcus]
MSREIPQPIRAYVGLAATVLDEARKLPQALPGLPVRVVGLAMQTALKVQQSWAGLVARGDEVLTGLRGEDEPGLATFDDDVEVDVPAGPSARASAFDRAAAEVPDHDDDLAVEDTAAALDETDAVVGLVDDEVSGLAAVEDPAEVAEALQDITDQVAAAEVEFTPTDAEAVLTAEDALESALLETDAADGTPAAEDTTGAETTEVDVLSPEGEVETVEATVTDEAIAAPETLADLAPAEPGPAPVTEADAATAVDEGGTPVAAATGVRTDVGAADTADESAAIAEGAAVDAVGEVTGAAPTDDPEGGSELSGSQAAGSAPIAGYDSWTVAQLRGRMRGYQLATVSDLLAYEESTRNRQPFVSMLRNRLEKLERQAVEASPLAPRGL